MIFEFKPRFSLNPCRNVFCLPVFITGSHRYGRIKSSTVFLFQSGTVVYILSHSILHILLNLRRDFDCTIYIIQDNAWRSCCRRWGWDSSRRSLKNLSVRSFQFSVRFLINGTFSSFCSLMEFSVSFHGCAVYISLGVLCFLFNIH